MGEAKTGRRKRNKKNARLWAEAEKSTRRQLGRHDRAGYVNPDGTFNLVPSPTGEWVLGRV